MRASSNPPQACLPDPHPSTRLPAWPSPLPPPQACLSDPHPGVSSLGLEAVDLAYQNRVVNNSLAANRNSSGNDIDPLSGEPLYPRVIRLATAKEVHTLNSVQAQAEIKCTETAKHRV